MTGEGPPSNVPPAAFGRFRVLHQIGAGSLGPVFRAEDPASQTLVVIKVLRLNLTPERARIVTDELTALQDRVPAHPGISPIVKAGIREVEPFVVSAYMPGDSLDVTLRELGPSSLAEALPRLVQLAAGLDFCADASIWHGALHPRDILISASETAIVGVGIAPILERVGVKLPVRRPYTAPEVVDGLATSAAADQYSLAAIVYEWLFGKRISGPAAPRIEVPETAGVDRTALSDAFSSALSADPGARFESSSAFVAALADATEKKTSAVVKPATSRVPPRRPRPATMTSIVPALPDDAARPVDELRPADAAPNAPASVVVPPAGGLDIPLGGTHASPGGTAAAALAPLSAGGGPPFAAGGPHFSVAKAKIVPPAAAPSLYPHVTWVNVAAGIGAAILLGSGIGYWFSHRQSTESPVTRPSVIAPPPATPAPSPTQTDATPAATPSMGPITPAPVPPDVATAAASPANGENPMAGQPTGRVLVRSTPAGAEVAVNGERRGVTPLALRDLPYGSYLVSITRQGYAGQQHQVTLNAARPSQSLEIGLAGGAGGRSSGSITTSASPVPGATQGSLLIESRPVGVTVYVDGRPAGITPIRIEHLAPGEHAVRLERSGYQAWTATVNVVPGEMARLSASLAGGQED